MGMSRRAIDMSKAGRAMPASATPDMVGRAMARPPGMKKGGMAKSGGSYRKAADGVASKGKTKGKMVRMNYGGKC